MLSFILIDVQYSQNAVFSFEKGSNRQNLKLLLKSSPPQVSPPFLVKISHPPITAIFEKSHPPFM